MDHVMPLAGPASAPAAAPGPSAELHHGAHGTKEQHDRHKGHNVGMFRRRFWVSLALTLPIVAFGHMVPSLFGWNSLTFPGSAYLPPVLGTVVFACGGSDSAGNMQWLTKSANRSKGAAGCKR
jgi:Cu2+-exporting ATPase